MTTESIKKKRVLGDHDDNEQQDVESPTKKLKTASRVLPNLSSVMLHVPAHQQRWMEINSTTSSARKECRAL
jgi:hypothetical protein